MLTLLPDRKLPDIMALIHPIEGGGNMSEGEICKKNAANIQATMFDGVTRYLCRDCHNEVAAGAGSCLSD
jgi:hypothetical protein